ncbi:MAG TPA: hypothetical protein VGN96_05675 [Roseococcus sp.]|jgi:hypothetical protein|nr:hypothetical protein [Roseococcus sp.]
MRTDYEGLYGRDYFAHAAGRTSFQPDFHTTLHDFARRHGLSGLLDLAAGNGTLAARMAGLGMPARSFDYRGAQEAGVLPLDLTAPIPDATRDAAREGWPGPWLTTCLDALEHIDPAEVWAALHSLHLLTREWLVVTVSHRPSSQFNRFHATVLPVETWCAMLEAAGFEVVMVNTPPFVKPALPPRGMADLLISQWIALNPFRAAAPFASSCLVLRKRGETPPREAVRLRFASLFPVLAPRPGREAAAPELPRGPVLLHLASLQDLAIMRPLLAALPPSQWRIGLRSAALGTMSFDGDMIEAFLAARGFAPDRFEDPGEWAEARLEPGGLFLSAHEGSFVRDSVTASLAAAAVRGRGLPAVQLQHGIFLPAPEPRPFGMFSTHLLSWAPEHAATLAEAGLRDPPEILVTGCPKFDLLAGRAELALQFGPWTRRYARVALIAANTHWRNHGHSQPDMLAAIADITRRHPDWLFLWKFHPVERHIMPAELEVGENVLFLTDAVLLCTNLTFQALVGAADVVICTQSTALLEAALADRPFVLLETEAARGYHHLTPVPAAKVALPGSATRSTAFRDHYLDPSVAWRGTELTLAALARIAANPPAPHPAWRTMALFGQHMLDRIRAASNIMQARDQALAERAVGLAAPIQEAEGVEVVLRNPNAHCELRPPLGARLSANRHNVPAPGLEVSGPGFGKFGGIRVNLRAPGIAVVVDLEWLGPPDAGKERVSLAGEGGTHLMELPIPKGCRGFQLVVRLPDGVTHPRGAQLLMSEMLLLRGDGGARPA